MSCEIRKYYDPSTNETLSLTSFVGGKNRGNAIQFTLAGRHVSFSEKDLTDLITTIIRRLECKKGYSATDYERENILMRLTGQGDR